MPLEIIYPPNFKPSLEFQFTLATFKKELENLAYTQENFQKLEQIVLDLIVQQETQRRTFRNITHHD